MFIRLFFIPGQKGFAALKLPRIHRGYCHFRLSNYGKFALFRSASRSTAKLELGQDLHLMKATI